MSSEDKGYSGMMRRRVGFGDNPMRRCSDRIQTGARILMAALFLAGCITAVSTGRGAYEQQRVIDRLDAKYGYQVEATIVSVSSVTGAQDGSSARHTYHLAWQDRMGRRHVDTLSTMTTTKKTGTVPVWIDHRGEASTTPHTAERTAAIAVFKGMTVVGYVAAALAVGYVALVFVLNRRRSNAWAEEWNAVEPQWRRQVL